MAADDEIRPIRDLQGEALVALAELGRIDLGATDLRGVLTRVAELVRDVVPAADEVSVTLVSAGVAGTAAYTGTWRWPWTSGSTTPATAPASTAAIAQRVNVIPDMTADQRWPAFSADALRRGVRGSLSVGIPVREAVTGALNLYGSASGAFDDDVVQAATAFAGHAAVALASAHLYDATAALADQMIDAVASRAVIEQAKGIIVAQQHVSPAEAFNILARTSQDANRKVRDIAQSVVDRAQRRS